MPTIDQLRREIAKEKAYIDYERNESEDYDERVKLQKQLKELQFNRKYGKTIEKAKPVISALKQVGNNVLTKYEQMQKNSIENERRDKAIRKKGFVEPRRSLFG